METPTKHCRQCKTESTLEFFGWQNHEKRIRRNSCRECDANSETLFGIENDYEARRAARLFRDYGVTPDDEQEILQNQNGCCASCGEHPDDKRLVVDYCHETTNVRGMLCPTCHSAVAQFGTDLTVMQRALDYLRSTVAA
jgi:hypothetical protein